MKIIQTPNRMEICINGLSKIFFGLTMMIVGAIVAYSSYQRAGLLPIAAGVIFVIMGLPLIFLAKNKSIMIEKGSTTTIFIQNIVLRSSRRKSIPTKDIVGVNLLTNKYQNQMARDGHNINRGNNERIVSKLSLLLKNNDLIIITSKVWSNRNENSSFELIAKAPLSKEAEQIATFLGVPLKANELLR